MNQQYTALSLPSRLPTHHADTERYLQEYFLTQHRFSWEYLQIGYSYLVPHQEDHFVHLLKKRIEKVFFVLHQAFHLMHLAQAHG